MLCSKHVIVLKGGMPTHGRPSCCPVQTTASYTQALELCFLLSKFEGWYICKISLVHSHVVKYYKSQLHDLNVLEIS